MDNNALGRIVDGDTLIFERTVPHAPERVWRAISDQQELTTWMRYPVAFIPEVHARVDFFGGENIGRVFIVDPPRTLAFSFWDANDPRIDVDWTVRWDLDPIDGGRGTHITFTHRQLQGHVMWGVGDGWHAFLDLLIAHVDGRLAEIPAASWDDPSYVGRIGQYRSHVSRALRAFATEASTAARDAIATSHPGDALTALTRLDLAVQQLYDIARQPGARPDFTPDDTISSGAAQA